MKEVKKHGKWTLTKSDSVYTLMLEGEGKLWLDTEELMTLIDMLSQIKSQHPDVF